MAEFLFYSCSCSDAFRQLLWKMPDPNSGICHFRVKIISLGEFLPWNISNIQRREIFSRIYAGARNGMCVLRAPRIQPLSEIWNSQMESELRDDERWDLQIPRHPAGHQSQTTSNNLEQPQKLLPTQPLDHIRGKNRHGRFVDVLRCEGLKCVQIIPLH